MVEYLEAENAYTEAMTEDLKPFSDALYKEMLGRIKQTDLSVPTRRGDYLYYSRTEEGKQYPIQCRRKGTMEAPEEVLLDLNELGKDRKFVGLGGFEVSDDHNLLAYTIDFTGFRQYALQVKDLRTGQTLADTTEARHLARMGRRQQDALPHHRGRRHQAQRQALAARAGLDRIRPLYEEKDELYDIGLGKTRDKKYLFLEIDQQGHHRSPLLCGRATPQDDFAVFLPREKKHRYYVDHREGLFYIRTNKSGRNFAVMTAPENDPAPQELEGLPRAPRRRPARGHRSVQGLRGLRWRSRRR